ncbi:MAG TPA: PAS domain S-box protein [Holophagaceae bacterium]|nr:PAS domain S-box protein [Holophagaceae bacterium]
MKANILIFGVLPTEGSHLQAILDLQGFPTQILDQPAAFLEAARANPDAILLVDLEASGESSPGLEQVEHLRRERDLPRRVLFMSGKDDAKVRLAAIRAGGLYFFRTPLKIPELLLVLEEITAREEARPHRMLLVGPESGMTKVYRHHLVAAGVDVRMVEDPLQILDVLETYQAELVLIDSDLSACTGAELAAVLRQHPAYRDIPLALFPRGKGSDSHSSGGEEEGEETILKSILPEQVVRNLGARIRKHRVAPLANLASQQEQTELMQIRAGMDAHAIVSVTDRSGRILFANDKFCEVSGYSRAELLGQTHRIVKSDLHPPAFFQDMWQTITAGSIWHGELQNRKKNGDHYWVETTIVPILGSDQKPVRFVAIRTEVTALHEAMEEARISADRLRRSQNFANIGTWDWNIQTGDLFWSERIAPLFGYPQGEMETSYENFLKAVHPEDRQALIDAVNACVERGAEYNIEHRVVWPDGSTRWAHETGDVVRAEDGTPLHMLGVVQDITRRKDMEDALRLSETRYRRLSEDMPIFITTFLPSGVMTYVNSKLSASVGMSQEQLTGMNFYDFLSPEEAAIVRLRLDALTPVQPLETHEQRYARPGEKVVFHQWTNRAFFDEEGRATHFQAVGQDITRQKEVLAALSESESFNQVILDSVSDEIAVLDRDGYIIAVNEPWKRFGLENLPPSGAAGSGIGIGANYLKVCDSGEDHHGGNGLCACEGIRAVIEGRVGRYSLEYACPSLDEQRWFQMSVTPLGPERSGAVVSHSNITDRKLALAALEQARAEAERANRAKSDFLSNMSHELRTPLNAILGFAQLIEARMAGEYAPQLQRAVSQIGKAGWHLLDLINEILDLAKVEAGKLDIEVGPVNVTGIADECVELIQPLADAASIRLTRKPEGASPLWMLADGVRLKQVLINLLSNAVKYNLRGGEIRLVADSLEGGRVRISVEDDGPGLSEDQQQRLFQPFERLGADQRAIEGTGIGLALAKQLMVAMGGTIGCESRLGHGARFWVELPAASPNASSPGPAPEAGLLPGSPSGHERAVLYVEDNPANLLLVEELVQLRPGIRLITAPLAEAGVVYAREYLPDLILMDINLPSMNGFEALQILRERADTRLIPVVALSANALPLDIQKALDAGFDGYLTKPLRVGIFLKLLDDFLGRTQDSGHLGAG